eukprot:superscaffoldBa00002495_g14460
MAAHVGTATMVETTVCWKYISLHSEYEILSCDYYQLDVDMNLPYWYSKGLVHQHRNLHVTVRRRSDGRMRLELCKECRLYHCPFCQPSVYKPKGEYASVWTHVEIHRMRALKHGAETVCQDCPGHVSLTEPELITNKARVITVTGVMEDISTFFKKCPNCEMVYCYQEWSEGLHNYNNHAILSLELCLLLRSLIKDHTTDGGLVQVLERAVGVKSPYSVDVLQAYLHFEALTSHSCPSSVMLDLYQKGVFSIDGMDMPESFTGDANEGEFWDTVCIEVISSALVAHLPEHSLIVDVRTRWNSFYLMVERFVEQYAAIQATTTDPRLKLSVEKKRFETLSEADLQKAEEFIRTMKPLYRSSLCVSADKSPTCSQIFPILKKLEAHFETQNEDSLFIATLKEKVWGDLSTCYKVSNQEEHRLQREDSDADDVSEQNDEYSDETPFPKKPRLTALEELFDEEDRALKSGAAAEKTLSILERVQREIQLYRNLPAIPTSEDALAWWWERQDMLPLLFELSNSYLCIQASSAGDTISQERSHIVPEQADMQIFLQKN